MELKAVEGLAVTLVEELLASMMRLGFRVSGLVVSINAQPYTNTGFHPNQGTVGTSRDGEGSIGITRGHKEFLEDTYLGL